MVPTPIPDDEVFPYGQRVVIGPPPGEDITGDIRAVEAVAWHYDNVNRYSMRVVLEDGDLERIQAGDPIWVTFLGSITPFYFTTEPPVG